MAEAPSYSTSSTTGWTVPSFLLYLSSNRRQENVWTTTTGGWGLEQVTEKRAAGSSVDSHFQGQVHGRPPINHHQTFVIGWQHWSGHWATHSRC